MDVKEITAVVRGPNGEVDCHLNLNPTGGTGTFVPTELGMHEVSRGRHCSLLSFCAIHLISLRFGRAAGARQLPSIGQLFSLAGQKCAADSSGSTGVSSPPVSAVSHVCLSIVQVSVYCEGELVTGCPVRIRALPDLSQIMFSGIDPCAIGSIVEVLVSAASP